ncbi:MAG: hypothetical protein Q7R41_13790, partial [Phycisphaerales bacterium]|nr:hypothetical protein [Phycisphaerales bacterium]
PSTPRGSPPIAGSPYDPIDETARRADYPGVTDEIKPPAADRSLSSGAQAAVGMGCATVLGILLTIVATGISGKSLVAYQRQADALESIAASMRSPDPPVVWEDSAGNDRCTIVEDGVSFRVEGEDQSLCLEFLAAHPWFPDLDTPNL